jgi:flagellar hook-associated protein FlgK
MFESIYISLTGLSSFSRNLTVIGNNVSNMNSAGFKNTELSFSDLVYQNLSSGRDGGGAQLQFGSGVGIDGTRVLFTQGSLTQTGNPTAHSTRAAASSSSTPTGCSSPARTGCTSPPSTTARCRTSARRRCARARRMRRPR